MLPEWLYRIRVGVKLTPVWFLLLILFFSSCKSDTAHTETLDSAAISFNYTGEIINGANCVSPPGKPDQNPFLELKQDSIPWAAVISWAFSRGYTPEVIFNSSYQWWGETENGVRTQIRWAREMNMKVMVKPQIWVGHGGWVGGFDLDSDEDWEKWEKEYSEYILLFAKVAEEEGAELFCVGTELKIPARERRAYWVELIAKVKEIFSGKITYAANWDNYQQVSFWDQVDYIGIDAYFPLVDTKTPSVKELRKAWKPIEKEIASFSGKHGKPILFTEYGYLSVDGTAGEHWNLEPRVREIPTNLQAQSNAYEAIFQTFWDKSYFAGGFFWDWHHIEGTGKSDEKHFTPQGKPAMKVIRKYYSN